MAVRKSVKAFQESFVTSDIFDLDDFENFSARQLRYRILWSFYENTSYSEVHTWAKLLKGRFALYKYIRNIYNPSYRIGDFQKTHIWGGQLDPAAGSGEVVQSAIPIMISEDNGQEEALREAISTVWQNSTWGVKKSLTTILGPILGDVALRIVDDEQRQKTYISVVHPGTIQDVELDAFGNVKDYVIEEIRLDDRGKDITYTEIAKREKDESGQNTDNIIFQTLKDDKPFGWDTNPVDEGGNPMEEWSVDYGFTPLVFWNHIDIGGVYGWSELHSGMSKIRESDDLASLSDDQIRKTVNPVWLMKGMKKPKNSSGEVEMASPEDTTAKPQAGRENVAALYTSSAEADAKALVAEIDMEGVLAHLNGVVNSLESDYPELSFEKLRLAGTATGAAIRAARQPASDKIIERRAIYDSSLVKAQQMAIAIGGERGYPGYEGFGLDSFDKGELDHFVGKRPVFQDDQIDLADFEKKRWEAVQIAVNTGASFELAVSQIFDLSESDLEKFTEEFATTKAAEILMDQEDSVPEVEQ